jgi:hypothetical protein
MVTTWHRAHPDRKVSQRPETLHTSSVNAARRPFVPHEVVRRLFEELLQWCGKWPQPKSILVMDMSSAVWSCM